MTAQTERDDLYDLLTEVATYLDEHADVIDGDDGTPLANRAIGLHTRVEQMLLEMDAAKSRSSTS